LFQLATDQGSAARQLNYAIARLPDVESQTDSKLSAGPGTELGKVNHGVCLFGGWVLELIFVKLKDTSEGRLVGRTHKDYSPMGSAHLKGREFQ
jgi:hypothetical protein